MNRKTGIVVLLFAICFGVICMFTACEEGAGQQCYRVYFGLNDLDTGTQEVTVEEAQTAIRAQWLAVNLGYTEYVTYGAYQEDGKVKGNDTLVYELFFTDRESVDAVIAAVKKELNLASVLVLEINGDYGFAA